MLAERRRLPSVFRNERITVCLMTSSSVSGHVSCTAVIASAGALPGGLGLGTRRVLMLRACGGSIASCSIVSHWFDSSRSGVTCSRKGSAHGRSLDEDESAELALLFGPITPCALESAITLCGFISNKCATGGPSSGLSHARSRASAG